MAGRVRADCVFCDIASTSAPASIVCEDADAVAFLDLRQFHPGHVLVIPRSHVPDVRDLDTATGTAVMGMLSRVTRAVGRAFPNEGLSIWSSIGEAAFQEVPHLHFHVHPRLRGDGVLKVYPRPPALPGRQVLADYAGHIRVHLADQA